MQPMMMIAAILLLGTTFIAAEPFPPITSCNLPGGIIASSTYIDDRVVLFHTLQRNASSSELLFAEGSMGIGVDRVYGMVLCRGDNSNASCSTCLEDMFQQVHTHICSINTDIFLANDMCVVQFGHSEILNHTIASGFLAFGWSGQNVSTPVFPGWNDNNIESISVITSLIKGLLLGTAKLAANNNNTRKYATGRLDISSTFDPIYSMAQCTPDLTSSECWLCLNNSTYQLMDNYNGEVTETIYYRRCIMAFNIYQFYAGKPMLPIGSPSGGVMPPPPQAVPVTRQKHKEHKKVIILVVTAAVAMCVLLFICIFVTRRQTKDHSANVDNDESDDLFSGPQGKTSEFTVYEYSKILEATGNFSQENKLGKGGFGPVYKGRFSEGIDIAVKRLDSDSRQGLNEFKNEISLIAKLQHRNLVKLLGCCYERQEKILVYEFLPNGSLDFFIFDETRRNLLDWEQRLVIIEGIAQGLLYLHKHSRLLVLHRDLKAANILLDHEMKPKISDFGLAKKFYADDTEEVSSGICGTIGYMSPEVVFGGHFSIKSDIYSFGVLMLEIISGSKNSSHHRNQGVFMTLVDHAWQCWKDKRYLEIVDSSLAAECNMLQVIKIMNIGLLCVQADAIHRPTMSHIIQMLSSDIILPEPKEPAYFQPLTREEASQVIELCSINIVTVSEIDGR